MFFPMASSSLPDDETCEDTNMSLRWKVSFALVSLFAVTTWATQFLHHYIIYSSYQALEQQKAQRDLDRCRAAIQREVEQLATFCRTRSASDEVCEFVQHPSQQFSNANMAPAAYVNKNLDLIWFLNPQGQVVWGESRDSHHQGKLVSMPDFPGLAADPSNHLGGFTAAGQGTEGILLTSRGMMLTVAQPIVGSQNKGPVCGTLIQGRLLRDSDIQRLRDQIKVQFTLWPDNSAMPNDLAKNADAKRSLALPSGVWKEAGDQTLSLYTRLADLSGRHGVIVRAEVPRDITRQGEQALRFVTLSNAIQAALAVALLYFVMQRLVITPLAAVKRHVVAVSRGESAGLMKIAINRDDEIGELAREFDQMILRLAELHSEMLVAKEAAESASTQAVAAIEEAVAASQSKGEFLACMSHEIRTPLGAVTGMITLLEKSNLDQSQRNYVEMAQQAAQSLLTVISNILDFSKIEAGKVELEAIPFDPQKLLQDVIQLQTPAAANKNLQLACFLSPELPRRAIGDPGRIQQVLTNLISNSIKFTPAGCVRVRAQRLDCDGERCQFRIEVQDTGIGIAGDRLERLFKKFSQVESSTTRRYGGSGLGLAICKRLVELMGGQIGVNSEEGAGSTFWFTLTLATAPQPLDESAAALAPPPQAPGLGMHVLVAEDNGMNQFVAKEMLKRAGCTCEIVANGLLAQEALEKGHFDAVLMDCQMPVVDGYEATQRIRAGETAAPERRRMPIIAVTANALCGDREKCLAAGMDDYVSKPIAYDKLVAALGAFAAVTQEK
jgi:signal transduction histidine kinase/ActR/RegA family two-component response regulator